MGRGWVGLGRCVHRFFRSSAAPRCFFGFYMKTSALKAALSVLICVAALAESARAGKNEASLEAELTGQFVDKTSQIRIVFGNYLTEPLTSGKDCYRLVDTELLPGGGSVRYQVKKGCVGLINLIPSPNH